MSPIHTVHDKSAADAYLIRPMVDLDNARVSTLGAGRRREFELHLAVLPGNVQGDRVSWYSPVARVVVAHME